jgi:hypothetical protein
LAGGPCVLLYLEERWLRLSFPLASFLEELAHVAPVEVDRAFRRQAVKHDFIPGLLVLADELPAVVAWRM